MAIPSWLSNMYPGLPESGQLPETGGSLNTTYTAPPPADLGSLVSQARDNPGSLYGDLSALLPGAVATPGVAQAPLPTPQSVIAGLMGTVSGGGPAPKSLEGGKTPRTNSVF